MRIPKPPDLLQAAARRIEVIRVIHGARDLEQQIRRPT